MKRFNFFIFLSLLLGVMSCSDTTEPSDSRVSIKSLFNSALGSTDIDGLIFTQAWKCASAPEVQSWGVSGSYFANGDRDYDNIVDAGIMTASDVNFVRYQFPDGVSDYGYDTGFDVDAQYFPVYGDTTTWGFSGSGVYSGFSHDMYVRPTIDILNDSGVEHHISQGFNLEWNSGGVGKIGIILKCLPCDAYLEYGIDISAYKDFQWYDFDVVDDGSYSIPTTVLNSLPDTSVVKIYIGRMDSKIVSENGKIFEIAAFSGCSGSYSLIP